MVYEPTLPSSVFNSELHAVDTVVKTEPLAIISNTFSDNINSKYLTNNLQIAAMFSPEGIISLFGKMLH